MTSLILALMLTVDAGVTDAGTVDTTLAELRRIAKPLEAQVKTPWVKSWVRAVNTLKPVAKPETYYCSMSRCEQSAFDGGVRREITDEFYYARIADPLGYARPFDVLAEYGVSIGKGSKVADLGYGSIGQLQMLQSIGVDVTGIEVYALLPIIYAQAQGPHLHILHGYFPQDAELLKKLGGGFDVFMSKNTLKRGYVHPDAETGAKPQIDLGMSDEQALAIIKGLLKPGGVFYIYNFSPPPAPPGKPFLAWSDGRSAFTKEAFEKAGFEVLAYDVDDSAAGRVAAKIMEWGPEQENTINAHLTLVRRPKK